MKVSELSNYYPEKRIRGIASSLSLCLCFHFKSLKCFYAIYRSEYIIKEIIKRSNTSLNEIEQTILESKKYNIFTSSNEEVVIDNIINWLANRKNIIED
jgi:hypothetical protein